MTSVVLSDWEILLLVAWSQVAESANHATELPHSVVAHDWEEDDDALAERLDALLPRPRP